VTRRRPLFALALAPAALALALAVLAGPRPSRAADAQLHIGAAFLNRTGSGPRAVIFIPAIASGAYVWDAVAPEVAQRYTVYTVTFAGFDGAPPTDPPYLDAFTHSIEELIAIEKLDKPILVGHSLGGFLALRVAEEIPANIGGVMVLDMIPRYPPSPPGEDPAVRERDAATLRNEVLAATPDQFEAGVHAYVAGLVTNPETAEMIEQLSLKSDRATFAGANYEITMADLRPNLGKITAPVEVVAPIKQGASLPTLVAFYMTSFKGVANLDVEPIGPSLHFLMYDQPAKFQVLLDAFLAKVAGSPSPSNAPG
jgi:pimeloyl-ACP methyl ester carboxylesterase